MWVISDNSALSALAEMGLLEVLPRIVGQVTLPAAVASEMRHPGAPDALRAWISSPPSWMLVVPDPVDILEETKVLGAGEAAAITLAWNHRGASFLILDEKRGRAVAKTLGLPVTGLLAILVEAAIAGEVEFEDALARLLATGFRLSSLRSGSETPSSFFPRGRLGFAGVGAVVVCQAQPEASAR